jgi:hypothetical protein
MMHSMYGCAMTNQPESIQRWRGMLFLVVSFAMMMWGQLVLNEHLSGILFTAYWVACFALAITAGVFGVLSVRGVLREMKAERNSSLRRAMRGIKRSGKRADGSLTEK